jgi:N-acetylglutamate synthase-like GNAT family acetyltransferase
MNDFREFDWKMEANEAVFCSMWADRIRVNEVVELFMNKRMASDYFYNRLNLYQNGDSLGALRRAEKTFFKRAMNCYVYVHEQNTEIQHTLLHNGFNWIDTMDVMTIDCEKYHNERNENGEVYIIRAHYADIPRWVSTFCGSFEIPEWQTEVQHRVELHFDKLILLISYFRSGNSAELSGCCALFINQGIMGLYCLGTVSKFRCRGVARKMISSSFEYTVENDLKCLFLQTFESQDLFEFYRKSGFRLAYRKRVYEKRYQEGLKPG